MTELVGQTHVTKQLDHLGREPLTASLRQRRPRLDLADDHLETERGDVADAVVRVRSERDEAIDGGLDAGGREVRDEGGEAVVRRGG